MKGRPLTFLLSACVQGPGGMPQFGVLSGACGVRVPGWQRRGYLGETRQLWVMPLHVLPPAVREGSLGWARALLRGHFTQPPVSSQSSPARCAWWQRWGEGDGAPKVPGYQAKPRGTRSCQPAAPHLTGPESWEHRRREASTQVRQASPAAKVAGAGGPCPSRALMPQHRATQGALFRGRGGRGDQRGCV